MSRIALSRAAFSLAAPALSRAALPVAALLSRAALAALLVLALVPRAARGDEGHVHESVPVEKLGTVHFPIAAGAKFQKEFDRAVALLHSFEYESAERGFRAIAEKEPKCAMAFWGIAMCNYHPIWGPTTQADFERGRLAVETAQKLGGKTDREQSYISAISIYYKDAERIDSSMRRIAYEKAMEQLHARFPDDLEGTIFYALSILGNAPTTDKTYMTQKRAADLLNAVLPKAKDHPGVAHYLIHSLDYPGLAGLALPAARAYAKIAPSAPHAQHMPSHIFTRLGLWDESIRSNLAAAKAAREVMAKTSPGSTYFEELHAMDYLTYAYLQLGKEDKAQGMVDAIHKVLKVNEETFQAAYAFAAVPARYALERHQWDEAAQLGVNPAWFPWGKFAWAVALTQTARGIGAARSGRIPEARAALAALDSLHQATVAAKAQYNWADQIDVGRKEVTGWIARAEKKDEEAVRSLRAAADLEDSIDKHPVTPGAMLPAREQLADLLVEIGKADEAVSAYEDVLKSSPGRRNSLRGLEQAKGKLSATDPASSRR
jgi:tetratricopeptide (TPR) repeat protein